MKFDDAVSEIYGPAIEHRRSLTRQYQNTGIAEAGNFARQAADAVLKAFRQIEQIFRSTYRCCSKALTGASHGAHENLRW
jgi:hypothetical protein